MDFSNELYSVNFKKIGKPVRKCELFFSERICSSPQKSLLVRFLRHYTSMYLQPQRIIQYCHIPNPNNEPIFFDMHITQLFGCPYLRRCTITLNDVPHIQFNIAERSNVDCQLDGMPKNWHNIQMMCEAESGFHSLFFRAVSEDVDGDWEAMLKYKPRY